MSLNFWKKEPFISETSEEAILTDEHDLVPSEIITSEDDVLSEGATDNIYNRVSGWVALVGVALFPLFFLPWTTSPLELNKQLFLILFSGIALVLWLVGVVSSGYIKWRPNEFIKPVGAVVLATFVAALFSITQFKSLFGLTNSLSDSFISIFALSILYVLIVNIFDDKGKKIRTLLAFSLTLAILYGIFQMFGIYLVKLAIFKSKSFNTVGSPNSLGVLAAVSLPFLHKSKAALPFVKHYWTKIATLLSIIILVILNWWLLWTIAIIGMFALVALESLNSKTFKLSKSLMPLVVIVLGVFLVVVKFDLSFVKKNLPVEISPSYSLSTRIANSVMKDRFILGYGLENFSLAFDKYGSMALTNTSLSNAKFYDSASEFFNAAVHGGIVLSMAFLFFAVFVVWSIFVRYKNESSDDDSDNGVMAMTLT